MGSEQRPQWRRLMRLEVMALMARGPKVRKGVVVVSETPNRFNGVTVELARTAGPAGPELWRGVCRTCGWTSRCRVEWVEAAGASLDHSERGYCAAYVSEALFPVPDAQGH